MPSWARCPLFSARPRRRSCSTAATSSLQRPRLGSMIKTTKSPPSTMFSNGRLRENGAKPTTTPLEKEEEGKGRRRTQYVAAPACAHAPTCCAPPWPFVLFVSYTSTCVHIHPHVLHIYIYMHHIYIIHIQFVALRLWPSASPFAVLGQCLGLLRLWSGSCVVGIRMPSGPPAALPHVLAMTLSAPAFLPSTFGRFLSPLGSSQRSLVIDPPRARSPH